MADGRPRITLTVPTPDHQLTFCPHCGGRVSLPEHAYWTPVRILNAARDWKASHGAQPTSRDWHKATYENPTAMYVSDLFGSWGAMISAAGYDATRSHTKWTRERVIDAFLDWLGAHGRWPTSREWASASESHPHQNTVRRLFGGWDEARRAAGYTGSRHAKLRSVSRNTRKEPQPLVPSRGLMVCAAPVATVILREHVERSFANIARDCGVDESYLERIARGDLATIRADYADMILSALDRPHVLSEAAA